MSLDDWLMVVGMPGLWFLVLLLMEAAARLLMCLCHRT